jgi:hypothetical protein
MSWFGRRNKIPVSVDWGDSPVEFIEPREPNKLSLAIANATKGTIEMTPTISAASSPQENHDMAVQMCEQLDKRAAELEAEIDRLNSDLGETLLSHSMYSSMIARFEQSHASPQPAITPPAPATDDPPADPPNPSTPAKS